MTSKARFRAFEWLYQSIETKKGEKKSMYMLAKEKERKKIDFDRMMCEQSFGSRKWYKG